MAQMSGAVMAKWAVVFWEICPKNTGLQRSTLSGHCMTIVFGPFEVSNYSQYYHCCEASRIEEEDLSQCVEHACWLSATTIVMYSLPQYNSSWWVCLMSASLCVPQAQLLLKPSSVNSCSISADGQIWSPLGTTCCVDKTFGVNKEVSTVDGNFCPRACHCFTFITHQCMIQSAGRRLWWRNSSLPQLTEFEMNKVDLGCFKRIHLLIVSCYQFSISDFLYMARGETFRGSYDIHN